MKTEVITMCGSTRFADLMAAIAWEYEKLGKIVLRVNYLPEWAITNTEKISEAQKLKIDELHCRKIDQSDKIFICNVDGYIGKSTANQIEYAKSLGKPIFYIWDGENDASVNAKVLKLVAEWKRINKSKQEAEDANK